MSDEQSTRLALTELTKAVNNHRVEIASKVSSLTTEVTNMKSSQDKILDQVNDVAIAQAGCPARTGWGAINARTKRLEKKTSSDRINPKEEIEDHTENIDNAALKAAQMVSQQNQSRSVWPILKVIIPWVAVLLSGALSLGFWLGSGGDDEKTAEFMKTTKRATESITDFGKQLDQLESRIDEKSGVALPVTDMEECDQ